MREELLSSLSSKEIAEDVIEGLDSDDAADALADLPEAKVEEAMRMVDDVESASEVLGLAELRRRHRGCLDGRGNGQSRGRLDRGAGHP